MVNNPPQLSSYISSDSEVLRTDTVLLEVGVSDIEDSAADLAVSIQHQAPTGSWSSAYIFNLEYNSSSGRWEASFTPPTMAELGGYDIQLRVTDAS